MACILLIEDDPLVAQAIERCLGGADHRVINASTGRHGLELAGSERPDLAILDLGLPDQSGFEVCRELCRLPGDIAVLMLTSRDSVDDRVCGLDAGADDYLAKPFDERELIARVAALLRRKQRASHPARVIVLGDVAVDLECRAATRGEEQVPLTKSEFSLLELLSKTPGRPVSREIILDVVLGYSSAAETRAVDTLVWRLRKKLGDNGSAPRWIKSWMAGAWPSSAAHINGVVPRRVSFALICAP